MWAGRTAQTCALQRRLSAESTLDTPAPSQQAACRRVLRNVPAVGQARGERTRFGAKHLWGGSCFLQSSGLCLAGYCVDTLVDGYSNCTAVKFPMPKLDSHQASRPLTYQWVAYPFAGVGFHGE